MTANILTAKSTPQTFNFLNNSIHLVPNGNTVDLLEDVSCLMCTIQASLDQYAVNQNDAEIFAPIYLLRIAKQMLDQALRDMPAMEDLA